MVIVKGPGPVAVGAQPSCPLHESLAQNAQKATVAPASQQIDVISDTAAPLSKYLASMPKNVSVPELRLSNKPEEMKERYDVLVIGSGYGGSVMAMEMARRGHRTCVIERGKEYHPGDFPNTALGAVGAMAHKLNPLGLFHVDGLLDGQKSVARVTASGVGGGSLVNAGIIKEPPPEAFSVEKGYPEGYYDMVLAAFHEARSVMATQAYDPTKLPSTKRALRTTAEAFNGAAAKEDAVQFIIEQQMVQQQDGPNAAGIHQSACNNCGNCTTGCNVGAKGSLDRSALQVAKGHGAELYAETEVERVSKGDDGYYKIEMSRRHGPFGWFKEKKVVYARSVSFSAGTEGTQKILQRINADPTSGIALSDTLGTGFSGQADVLGFVVNGEIENSPIGKSQPIAGVPTDGPGVTVSVTAERQGPVGPERVQDATVAKPLGGIFSLIVAPVAIALGAKSGSWKKFWRAISGPVKHSQVFLGNGSEAGEGKYEMKNGKLRLVWPDYKKDAGVNGVLNLMKGMAASVGGDLFVPSVLGDNLTTHPVGGAGLGRVTNYDCQLKDPSAGPDGFHDRLVVADGSLLDASAGSNPSGTIAAMAYLVAPKLHMQIEAHRRAEARAQSEAAVSDAAATQSSKAGAA